MNSRIVQKIRAWRLIYNKKGFHKEEDRLYHKNYISDVTLATQRCVIFMVDGQSVHGGLTDRIKAICTIYSYCKQNNIRFYINFVYPFKLQDYLVPNKYDWIPPQNVISYNSFDCRPILLNTHQLLRQYHLKYLNRMIKKCVQLHVYGNTDVLDSEFYGAFNELFRPSPVLEADIEKDIRNIGKTFVAVVFRFQQLLGDFKERNYKVLDVVERNALIEKSKALLYDLHDKHKGTRILVTSDSGTFLGLVSQIEFVYVVPGRVVHMDYTDDADFFVYEKSFIDLLMLSRAQKVYLACSGDMYRSGFAKRGAMIGNVDYEELFY